SADADGNIDQPINGARIEVSGGKAHAQANLYNALAVGSDAAQTVAPFDQVKQLFDAAIGDAWANAVSKFPPPAPAAPPCQSGLPAPSNLSTFSAVCSSDLPLHSVFVSAAGAEASTHVATDTTGTLIESTSQVNGVRILDGIIDIGSIRTTATAQGDGSAE